MKTMSKKLLPCPFCGKIPEVVITDDEGNLHDEDYAKNPYSGLWYSLAHYTDDCVIGIHEDCYYTGAYKTKAEAINAWNTRNYLEKQDSSKELMEFVKFCRNASVKDIRQIHDRARDLIANYKECCEKSCKDENATCKKNLQVSRSDIEAMVKLEWHQHRSNGWCTYINSGRITIIEENAYVVYFEDYKIWSAISLEQAQTIAKDWVVDFICSALRVEE